MYSQPSRHQLDKAERKDATRARMFQPNPALERVVLLRQQHPELYAALSPTVKMSVAHYETGKAAAQRTEDG